MPRFEFVRPRPPSGTLSLADLDAVVGSLRAGGLAVLPTETGSMLAAMATDEAAMQKAFTVKGRDPTLVMHVACSSLVMVETVAALTPAAVRLLGAFTPGPLSLVLDKTPLLPDRLVTRDGTVGIRVPDHAATLQVVAAVGSPLTATSLNASGQPPVALADAALRTLDWPDELVHVVVDETAQRFATGSSLVRLAGEELQVLRPGPVEVDQLRAVLA